jgi:hypothetical protein
MAPKKRCAINNPGAGGHATVHATVFGSKSDSMAEKLPPEPSQEREYVVGPHMM